jgi:hypothetical protein
MSTVKVKSCYPPLATIDVGFYVPTRETAPMGVTSVKETAGLATGGLIGIVLETTREVPAGDVMMTEHLATRLAGTTGTATGTGTSVNTKRTAVLVGNRLAMSVIALVVSPAIDPIMFVPTTVETSGTVTRSENFCRNQPSRRSGETRLCAPLLQTAKPRPPAMIALRISNPPDLANLHRWPLVFKAQAPESSATRTRHLRVLHLLARMVYHNGQKHRHPLLSAPAIDRPKARESEDLQTARCPPNPPRMPLLRPLLGVA